MSGDDNTGFLCTCPAGGWWSVEPPPPCPIHSYTVKPYTPYVPYFETYPSKYPPQPWVCPKCDKVKAPHIDECPCNQVTWKIEYSPTTTSTTTITDLMFEFQNNSTVKCKHEWEHGVFDNCLLCGKSLAVIVQDMLNENTRK